MRKACRVLWEYHTGAGRWLLAFDPLLSHYEPMCPFNGMQIQRQDTTTDKVLDQQHKTQSQVG